MAFFRYYFLGMVIEMPKHPYADLPDYAFWRRAISGAAPEDVDPVISVPFTISKADPVATAGSCFAQYIGSTLSDRGFNFFVAEDKPLSQSASAENFGIFSARYANVYTTRQLLQLFERAYGTFNPCDQIWQRADGAFIDPFRPQIQKAGFPTPSDVTADREAHLGAVRTMFEQCKVFIFTLGLTEVWLGDMDGAAVPLAPFVDGSPTSGATYHFTNFKVPEMCEDLDTFIDRFRKVNPTVRVILTVSPVPLIATYEKRHVLVSTVASKAKLRVVADIVSQNVPNVAYFPAFEIITGQHSRGKYFESDLRTVTPEGVAQVMTVFTRHFLAESTGDANDLGDLLALQEIICEEETLDRP
jgi:GSCFA family